MANCVYCGQPAEMFQRSHYECDQVKNRCTTQEEFLAARDAERKMEAHLESARNAVTAAARAAGTQYTIMMGVFKGMWLFTGSAAALGLIVGLIYIIAVG